MDPRRWSLYHFPSTKIYLSTSSEVRDILDNEDQINLSYFDRFDKYYPISVILKNIYIQSIVDIDDHYFNCARLSYICYESQKDIDNLEYYVFNNKLIYISKIIDEQNEGQDGNKATETYEGMKGDMKKLQKSMMSSSKLPKTPKIPKL